jgi:GT2 family glycosyltransferase
MKVTVSIVSYNSAETIGKCLESLINQKNIMFEIIVVDNKSRDHTVRILESFVARIKLFVNSENVGFGRAHNQAFAASGGEYFFVLNPDASMEDGNALRALADYMDSRPSCALVGTSVADSPNSSSANYPGERYLKTPLQRLPGEVAWVLGASMFIRRSAYAEINGFDDDFFLYSEETDLCLRLRKTGFTIDYFPQVCVSHVGGVSEKSNSAYSVWRRRLNGLYLFYQKHYTVQDTLRLLKRDRRRATVRLFLSRFTAPSTAQDNRVAKYRAILDSTIEWLERIRAYSPEC